MKNTSQILVTFLLPIIFISSLFTVNADSIKVLYLGNSHTFWHELPQVTANLALSNGDTISFASNTPGGCTLGHPQNGHLFNGISLALIDSTNWDYVVLQEHSLFAVIDHYRDTYMYPGAKALDSLIKQNYNCTKTMVQLIWGKKYGGQHCINTHCTIDFDDYAHMQDSLSVEYIRLGDTLSCMVAPTGVAWKQSIQNGDPIELFDPDESHPSLAGTYLSACVYYSMMFQKSSAGITYNAGLSSSDAQYLQQIADQVVFSNPELWNVNGNIPEAGFDYNQIGNTVYFNDMSVNANSYYWDFGDGTFDSVQNPVHSYLTNGTYLVTQEVDKFCNTDTAQKTVEIISTSVNNNYHEESEITFVYDKISDHLNIYSINTDIQEVEVYSITGSLLFKEIESNSSHCQVSMKLIPAGLNFVVVNHNGKTTTYRLVH